MNQVEEHSFGIIPLKHVNHHWNVFIILHKQGNHWSFPKGKANKGEDSLISAQRELFEETGLKVDKFLLKEPLIEEYSFIRDKEKVNKKVFYFPAIVSGKIVLQTEEIREGKWLDLEKAIEQLTFPEAKNICKKIKHMVRM